MYINRQVNLTVYIYIYISTYSGLQRDTLYKSGTLRYSNAATWVPSPI